MFYGYHVDLDGECAYTVPYRDNAFDHSSIVVLWRLAKNGTKVTLNYDS